LAEARLADRPIDVDAHFPERAVLALDGAIRINDTPLTTGSMAVLERGAATRLSGTGLALVIGGEPIGKRHIWWNFVHSDPERIDDAKQRWVEQRFPRVPDDHDVVVPLPSG
jgi:redox-sensitive bicupin YhaK (pirin superfamily)